MAVRQQIDIRRTTNTLELDQALLYVEGVEAWAGLILKRDLKDGDTDSLDEAWATPVPPIPVDGGQLAGSMEDMQARFNLNSLVKDGKVNNLAFERFQRLLSALELPVELADAVVDWLDADDDVRMGGAEQVEYLSLQPPYRASNGLMASPSELLLVKGMRPEIYAKLLPYVSVLPEAASLNVSTTQKRELIMCLADGIDKGTAEQVLGNRGNAGFTSKDDFTKDPLLEPFNIGQDGIDVKSSYFMVTSHVQVGRSVYTTYSLLKRSSAGTQTVMRAQGIY